MSGLSLPMVLFIIFLVLKLTGVITWAWIWVFAPLWIGLVFGLVILVITGLVWLVVKS